MGDIRKGKTKAAAILITVFVILYIPSLLHWIKGENVSVDIIRYGIIEDVLNADGLIVRSETVFKSQYDGKFIPTAAEGDKVAADMMLATVLMQSSVDLMHKLEDKRKEIISLQNEKSENGSIFAEDIKKIDVLIADKTRLIVEQANINTLSEVGMIKDDINRLLEKKSVIIGGISTSDAYINMLKKEADDLQKQVYSNTGDVSNGESGIVSYIIDGYEEILKPEGIKELTPEYILGIKPGDAIKNKSRDVTAQKPFIKVIDAKEQFIVIVLDKEAANNYKAGETLKLRINDIGREISAKVSYKSEEINGKYIMAVVMDRCISDTTALRKVNVDLVSNSAEGLKVSVRCLRNFNETERKAQIVLVRANSAVVKNVNVDLYNDEYAIISSAEDKNGVGLYDSYVIDHENIEEGQIINP